jgi:hypothetical protein
MLERGVAGYFVKASGIAIKHGLTRPSADVSDTDSSAWTSWAAGLDLLLFLARADCGVIRCRFAVRYCGWFRRQLSFECVSEKIPDHSTEHKPAHTGTRSKSIVCAHRAKASHNRLSTGPQEAIFDVLIFPWPFSQAALSRCPRGRCLRG